MVGEEPSLPRPRCRHRVTTAPYYQMTWEDKWVVGGGGLAQFLELNS